MREVTQKVYSFSEISPEVRQEVIDRERNRIAEIADEDDSYEYRGCLDKIEEKFGIDVYQWEVGAYRPAPVRFRMSERRWQGLEDDPKFLPRYLRELSEQVAEYEKHWGKRTSRRSKIFKHYNWTLTGTWTDEAVMEMMTEMYEFIRRGWTIAEFCEELLDRFFAKWLEDIEYHCTDDFVADEIEAREEEFLENGRHYYEY